MYGLLGLARRNIRGSCIMLHLANEVEKAVDTWKWQLIKICVVKYGRFSFTISKQLEFWTIPDCFKERKNFLYTISAWMKWLVRLLDLTWCHFSLDYHFIFSPKFDTQNSWNTLILIIRCTTQFGMKRRLLIERLWKKSVAPNKNLNSTFFSGYPLRTDTYAVSAKIISWSTPKFET